MPRLKVANFDLRSSVECGQLFTYHERGDFYYITAASRLFAVRQRNNDLEYRGADANFIRRFFRLNDDLASVQRSLPKDPALSRAFASCRGLRLVSLDVWEALLGFLCSAACNIPRIRNVLGNIARKWGTPLELDGIILHALPRPDSMPPEAKLRKAGAGFRAAYISRVAGSLNETWLESLCDLDYTQARNQLMSLPGVGPKIADCVCLFSLGFLEAFPVDTWIRKIMIAFYFPGSNPTDQDVRRFAQSYFGRYAGYAQQYLYAFYRCHPPGQWKQLVGDGRIESAPSDAPPRGTQ